ncbi:MAG: biopolymer transporter ExbD [Gammaproteobacteria bacterium]|nr:biopolymer transporter ExbD [Gammaproteobacteria bacterium]
MNLRSQRREELELNITPLIDVVFLLLIFFMVSTTFERESEINITLPEASEEYTESELDQIEIAIDKDGRVFVNNESLLNSQTNTIRDALQNALYDLSDPQVIINADAGATHQMVVRVMDAARQLDLVKITFATQGLEDSGE